MIITLGPISLGENFVLRGLDAAPVSVETQRLDSGIMATLIADLVGGKTLQLYGWYTIAQELQVDALMAAKATVSLVHPRFSGKVLITGKSLNDVVEYMDPLPEDFREGYYQLLEV